MFKHLFKLIWNKKKENFLLISEVLISFMVIFAVLTLIVYYYQNYKRPMGFNDEQVWSVSFSTAEGSNNKNSVTLLHENLRNVLKSMPQVKAVTFSGANFPFSSSTFRSNATYKGPEYNVDVVSVEDDYKDVLGINVLKGRWFSPEDNAVAFPTVVINNLLKEKLMGAEEPIGKIIKVNDKDMKIVGVIQDQKDKGDFKEAFPAFYTRIDTGNVTHINDLLIKVSPDADANFEGKMYKIISNAMKSANLEIKPLSDLRVNKNKETKIPMFILLIVAGFLILNVALGLFGVLWHSINKRRGEIGLRRAIGASASSIFKQLVGEALVLATFALIIGSFFAIQFPLLNVFDLQASIYITAQLLSTLFIYLLVIFCALYPGKQAASIYPAVALHEE